MTIKLLINETLWVCGPSIEFWYPLALVIERSSAQQWTFGFAVRKFHKTADCGTGPVVHSVLVLQLGAKQIKVFDLPVPMEAETE